MQSHTIRTCFVGALTDIGMYLVALSEQTSPLAAAADPFAFSFQLQQSLKPTGPEGYDLVLNDRTSHPNGVRSYRLDDDVLTLTLEDDVTRATGIDLLVLILRLPPHDRIAVAHGIRQIFDQSGPAPLLLS